jgi:DNA-binding NarL/FixJ family response regulator
MVGVASRETGPRFLIADDHAIFAEALRVYLEKIYTILGVVLDGHALVVEAMRLQPDVVVVDVGMPVLNGLDAARKIKEQAPNIKIIFLTMQDDPNVAAAALELGPIAYVLKHSSGTELLKVTTRSRNLTWRLRKAGDNRLVFASQLSDFPNGAALISTATFIKSECKL